MTGDDLKTFLAAEELDGFAGDEAMAGAVETVAADIVLVGKVLGDRVGVCRGGHGRGAECGVENCNLGNVAHNLFAGVDAHEVCGVVQGAQGDAGADSVLNFGGDKAGCGEADAAVENTVADGADVLHGGDNTGFGIGETLAEDADCIGVGVHVNNGLQLAAVAGSVDVFAAFNADSFAETLGNDLAFGHIEELILQRRASGVDNKDEHFYFFLSC